MFSEENRYNIYRVMYEAMDDYYCYIELMDEDVDIAFWKAVANRTFIDSDHEELDEVLYKLTLGKRLMQNPSYTFEEDILDEIRLAIIKYRQMDLSSYYLEDSEKEEIDSMIERMIPYFHSEESLEQSERL